MYFYRKEFEVNNIFQNAAEVKAVLPQGKTIALVGGCFDLIHVGHLHLLEYAASLEDILLVAVLSDVYVRGYKDSQRPIISQTQRAKMIASIRYVDFVYISDVSPSSVETLQLLKPDSVVFSEEGNKAEKRQSRMQNLASSSPSTKIRFLPRYSEEDVSTGKIIERIKGL